MHDLIKKCYFYIGTSSGIADVAYMFNKPVLTLNLVEIFGGFPRKKIDRAICKKIFKKNGEEISLKSFIDLPWLEYHSSLFPITDLKFEENSPSEILEAVIEFENNINREKTTNLQKQIKVVLNSYYEKMINEYIKSQKISKDDYAILQIRRFKNAKGYFCQSYLKNKILNLK